VLQWTARGRRLRLKAADRVFWVWLSRLWKGWQSAVKVAQPETVIAWNRKGVQAVLDLEKSRVLGLVPSRRYPMT